MFRNLQTRYAEQHALLELNYILNSSYFHTNSCAETFAPRHHSVIDHVLLEITSDIDQALLSSSTS